MRLRTTLPTLIKALAVFALASVGLTLFGPTAGAAPVPADTGEINFETATQTVNEGNGFSITLTRTGGSDGRIDAFVVITGGTATTNVDYADFDGIAVSWADGETSPKTITIATFPDPITEGDETLTIQLIAQETTTATNAAGPNNTTTITIEDDPVEPGEINFGHPTQTVTEGDNFSITLTRTGGSDGPIDAIITPTGGTATNNLDYADFSGINISWADGETSPKTIAIPTFADPITEGDETLTIQLIAQETTTATNAAGPNNTTTITITESLVTPTPDPIPSATPIPDPTPSATPSATPTPDPTPSATPSATPSTTPNRPLAPLTVPTPTPDPIVGPIVAATISANIENGTATVTVPGALSVWIETNERVIVKAGGAIVFDGTLPSNGIVTFPWTSQTELTSVTFTSRLTTGAPYSEHVVITQAGGDKNQAVALADRRARVSPASPAPLAAMPTDSETAVPFGLTGLVLTAGATAFVFAAATGRRRPVEF